MVVADASSLSSPTAHSPTNSQDLRELLTALSSLLLRIPFLGGTLLDQAANGDVAYCDPTYTVTHDQNGFIRYNERNFSWPDQERLANAAMRAAKRGATVIVSNAHHIEIARLYKGAKFETLARPSTLSPDPSRRRTVWELLIIL
jgi:DNA adenine methylase